LSEQSFWGIIGLLLVMIPALIRSFPKKISEHLRVSFIDDENGLLIEQREFEFSWGFLFFWDRLKLIEVPKSASYEITYKPINGLETMLPSDCYTEKIGKIGRVIYLKNRSFFNHKNIKRVFLLIKSPVDHSYKENIRMERHSNFLEIINNNNIEIRNYNINLSKDIQLENIKDAKESIEHVRIEIPLPQLEDVLYTRIKESIESGLAVMIMIKRIPPKQGNIPGKIKIQLS